MKTDNHIKFIIYSLRLKQILCNNL